MSRVSFSADVAARVTVLETQGLSLSQSQCSPGEQVSVSQDPTRGWEVDEKELVNGKGLSSQTKRLQKHTQLS